MDILFFGIQGSGKGTQAKKLAEDHNYYIFEAGGELRNIASSGTELGNTVKQHIDEGLLVPFEIIMEVVREAIAQQPVDQKILFDGIPRDTDQMESFDEIMKDACREFACIHFLLDDDEAFKRILSRAEIEGRADDADEEKIHRRMNTFKEKTLPVIKKYENEEKVIEVDANAAVEDVYASLIEKLPR